MRPAFTAFGADLGSRRFVLDSGARYGQLQSSLGSQLVQGIIRDPTLGSGDGWEVSHGVGVAVSRLGGRCRLNFVGGSTFFPGPGGQLLRVDRNWARNMLIRLTFGSSGEIPTTLGQHWPLLEPIRLTCRECDHFLDALGQICANSFTNVRQNQRLLV